MTTDPSPGPEQAASFRRGIAWMLFAILVAVCMDGIAKHLVQTYASPQVVWGRFLFQAIVVVLVLSPRLRRVAPTRSPGIQILRSTLLLGASVCFATGLKWVPLADASAILFVAPLIVIALAPALLRESAGGRRWAAVLVGFSGAMIIIRPGTEMMQLGALFPMMTAVFYAFYMITTRHLSRSDSAWTTLFYTAMVGAVVLSLAVPFFWRTPTLTDWGLMALQGALGGLCHFGLIRAFEEAPAPVVSPYEYSRLVWATILGFILFGDFPDLWTISGAVLIVGSGAYIFHYGRRKSEPSD